MLSHSCLSALALLASGLQQAVEVVAARDDGLSWTIYHSWNSKQEFTRRGSLDWGPESSGKGEGNDFRITNDDDAGANLTSQDIKDMLEYGWYHVKIQGEDESFVFQTVPACNLRRANFKDEFEFTLPRSSLGNRQDPVTSFAYTPLVSPLAPKTCGDYEDIEDTRSFSSRVTVHLDTPAMALKNILPQSKPPPGIAFVKQPGTGTGKKKGSATGSEDSEEYDDSDIPPNEIPTPMSFLQKYWYIILPMVLMQFLAVEEEQQPAQQQGQQQQGAGQNSGGTIAPAAASGQKMRRGKTSKSKNN